MLNSMADELFLYKEPIQAKGALADIHKWLNEKELYPFEDHIIQRMLDSDELFIGNREWLNNKKDFMDLMGRIERESEALTRKAVRSIYTRTQAELERNGVKWLTLYRGAQVKNAQVADWHVGDPQPIATNALSSWSVSEAAADKFADQAPDEYLYHPKRTGLVLATTVPASRVYSLPVTGVGCLDEWEVVLLGGHPNDTAQVKTTYREKRQTA
jgi:hypothetical protein